MEALEPSWGHLGRPGAMFRRVGALLDRLGGLLVLSWFFFGRSVRSGLWTWVVLWRSWAALGPSGA
eukprot:9373131-Pyramimonas_sp.AAC.1